MTENEQLFSTALKKAEERMARLESALLRTASDAASAAIRAAGGGPELLGPSVAERLKVFEADGQFVVGVADERGAMRIRDSKGTPFTVEDFVGELKSHPTYSRAFAGSDAKLPPNSKGADQTLAPNTKTRAAFDQLTPAGKMSHIKGGGRVVD